MFKRVTWILSFAGFFLFPHIIHAQQVLVQDDFEASGWSATWDQNPIKTLVNPERTTKTNDNSNYPGSASGSRAVEVGYPAGVIECCGINLLHLSGPVLPDEFLIEFDFKLSANFHWPLHHKWWRALPNMSSGQGPDDTQFNNNFEGYGSVLSMEVYSNSSIYGYKEFVLRPSIPVPTVGVWHRIGYRYKKNTFNGDAPNSDGQIEVFFDGVARGSANNVRLTAAKTKWATHYWGGPGTYTSVTDNNRIPENQWIRVDNFKITDLTNARLPATDSTPPIVSITAPSDGTAAASTIIAAATATDNVGVVGVQFKLDGQNLGAEDSSTPYSISWNTTTTSNGTHILTATARDAAGNTATSTSVSVNVSNVAAFDFSLTNAGSKSVTAGSSVSNSINARLVSGSSQAVTFSASGFPAGVTASFSPSSCTLTCSSNLTITTSGSTPAGTSNIIVTGTGGGISRTTTFSMGTSVPVASSPSAGPAPTLTNECSNPQEAWIWCDDFEANRLASYFEYDSAGGDFVPLSNLGVNGSSGMRVIFRPGQSNAGNLKLAFGSTPSSYLKAVDAGSTKYREIYWRMYVKNQLGWTGGGADKLSRAMVFANSNWAEAAIGHVWSGTAPGPDQDFLFLDPVSGTDAAGNLKTTGYNDFANLRWLGATRGSTELFNDSNVGKWYCVEAQMKLNHAGASDGVFQMWIDGTLTAQKTNLNWLGSYSAYGINTIFFENYWNTTSPVVEQRYFDNIVVSTQPIGCGSLNTSGSPTAPSNLSLMP